MELNTHRFIFPHLTFDQLKEDHIRWNSDGEFQASPVVKITVENLEINQGHFTYHGPLQNQHTVSLIQQDGQIILFCNCEHIKDKLCQHQAAVLMKILQQDHLKIFFNNQLRQIKLKQFASDFGMEKEDVLDLYFHTRFENGQAIFIPKQPGLIPVNRDLMTSLTRDIIGKTDTQPGQTNLTSRPNVLVLRGHRHYQYLMIELYHAPLTKEGKPKNPFTPVPPMDSIWGFTDAGELKFMISVAQFQKRLDQKLSDSDMMALRNIIRNPLQCHFFSHDPAASENISATSVHEIKIRLLPGEIELLVRRKDFFYQISGFLHLDGEVLNIKDTLLRYNCFIQVRDTFYLVDNTTSLSIMELLKKHPDDLYIHATKFPQFKTDFLDKVDARVKVSYEFIPRATAAQIEEYGFDSDVEAILYLSDLDEFIKITPVMRYSDVEINIRTKRTIYGLDTEGKEFLVPRDKDRELKLLSLLIRQHPYFKEQLENELEYFYLHRKHFLDENWFLKAFNNWREHKITILGFNKLTGNKLNPYSAKVSVKVESGINWFNTKINIRFGKRKASLKKVQIAVRNKSRYIQLDDGTLGILPEEWIRKFEDYFHAGEIVDEENLRTAKINFSAITTLYDPEMIGENAKNELQEFKEKFAEFGGIKSIEIPSGFSGSLRPYQKEGLNWLNFLDDFNFGGCLADDMGLGKTVQIIAFILSQRNKKSNNTNLIVVPTSVLFNWKQEINRFAPDIQLQIIHGPDRQKSTTGFAQKEIILTTYTTLLIDINYLKKFSFNYIFLDESQNIKNPDTQRYRAVMQLKARNRITITGTPVENNTFDLFSQFSFACPGLLGNQSYFRAIYSIPIDKFKSSRRAEDLQKKIQPFLLRRTKNQVAQDLPAKTEMVLYCELKPEQKKIYEAHEKEFRDYISATDNDELRKNSMHVLRGLTKLRQICNSPKLIEQEVKDEATSAKIDILMEQIQEQTPQNKLLIFSQFVGMLELIESELDNLKIGYVTLTGSTRNRQELVEKFQKDAQVRIFLISLKAGGTGLNLTEASYVYLIDPWWNPATENQAIDRAHRIGQQNNVTAIRLITPDTIEEKIIELQKSKKALSDDLIKADNAFFQSLSQEDLLSLFRKN